MRNSILPMVVLFEIIGLGLVIAFGCFEWIVLIPKNLLPVWIHVILNLWMALVVVGLIISTFVHFRDLRRQRNSVES